MTEEKNTVDYTIRGIPKSLDNTLNHLSTLTGTPKSVLVREKLIEVFTDRIKTFGMLNPLVAALDEIIAHHIKGEVLSEQVDNHYGTKWNIELRKLLDIKSDDDLQRILVSNTPYLTVRADQVMQESDKVPKSTSLWFALFAEVAFSTPEVVKQAWKTIFHSYSGERYYQFYNDVNALRRLRHLDPIAGWVGIEERAFGTVRLYKPEAYQYGAWRIEITLNGAVAAAVSQDALTGLRFPKLAQRQFVASSEGGYGCAAPDDQGEFELGFFIANGRCELDLYSTGVSEDLNRTPLLTVVAELANVVEARVQPLMA
ncbi:hypothetical protein O8E94_002981 [Yersinia ruckeri]|nr:hypothetical protein [Yersinia ruckeri]